MSLLINVTNTHVSVPHWEPLPAGKLHPKLCPRRDKQGKNWSPPEKPGENAIPAKILKSLKSPLLFQNIKGTIPARFSSIEQ